MFHILVVDDDKNTRRLMQAVLQADGYGVSLAENGETALALLEREQIDLVVLDIMMPKMDGYEFTKTLREANSSLPILMVSAKQLPADRKQGFLAGTDDYMTKPVDEEEMLLRIKALLRRSRIADERRLTVGDVVLDYDAMTDQLGSYDGELAKLIYHCGVSVRMSYGWDGSGSQSEYALGALQDHYFFSDNAQFINISDVVPADSLMYLWVNKAKAELDARRPLFFSGQSNAAGHLFPRELGLGRFQQRLLPHQQPGHQQLWQLQCERFQHHDDLPDPRQRSHRETR